MENNPPQPQPVQPVMQAPQQDSSGSNKLVFWLITGLIITIMVVGAVYWYLSTQQTESQKQNSKPIPIQADTVLESDLNTLDIQDIDAQFPEVDKDINSL